MIFALLEGIQDQRALAFRSLDPTQDVHTLLTREDLEAPLNPAALTQPMDYWLPMEMGAPISSFRVQSMLQSKLSF